MSYEARKKEVFEALDKTDFAVQEKEKIRKAADSYFRQREGFLTNLLEELEPGRSGPCHAGWLDKAKKAMDVTNDLVDKAEAGKLWLAKIVNEEHLFFFNIYKSQVPVHRDKMMKQSEKLKTAMVEFENKWEKIKDSDAEVDARLKKIAEEYEETLRAAAQIAAVTEKESKEKAMDTFKKVLTLGLGMVNLGIIEQVLKGGASAFGKLLNQAQSRKLEIFALLSVEEKVFAMFKESREIVADFLEENGYPALKDAWDEGDKAADALPGLMNTPGQKSDASEFSKAIAEELKKVFGKAEQTYKEFARKHEFLFFGPLGAGYYKELSEDDTWKKFSENWKKSRADFDDLLRERTFEANKDNILEISLEGMSDEDKERLYFQLRDPIRELLQAWNKWKEFSDDPYWILDSREQTKRVLDAMK